MAMTRFCKALWLALALVLATSQVWAENVAEGKEDADWRSRALALNDLTGAAPMRGKLKEMLVDKANTKKIIAAAMKLAKNKPQPFNRNATFLLALVAEDGHDIDSSAFFYRLNAKQNMRLLSEQAVGTAYVGLMQMYAENKHFNECEKVCDEFLKIEPVQGEGEEVGPLERLKPMVMRRMILAIARQGSIERAMKKVDELIKEQPRNWLHRVLKAQIQREDNKTDEAVKTYLDVIDRVSRDKRISKEDADDFIDQYRYTLSGLYVELNQIDKAAEQLKLLLAHEPNNPTYNNDLGFIWADRGMNLAESEKLIRKAIDEERKLRRKANPSMKAEDDRANAAYLDSLGWVLFKQGKAKEAKPYLLESVKERDGQSLEVWEHLGDVHLALGEKTEAIAAWKKAVASATDSKRDKKRKVEVEKKVKAHEGK